MGGVAGRGRGWRAGVGRRLVAQVVHLDLQGAAVLARWDDIPARLVPSQQLICGNKAQFSKELLFVEKKESDIFFFFAVIMIATVGSLWGLHCETIILIRLLANLWTMEAIVCPAKSSKQK